MKRECVCVVFWYMCPIRIYNVLTDLPFLSLQNLPLIGWKSNGHSLSRRKMFFWSMKNFNRINLILNKERFSGLICIIYELLRNGESFTASSSKTRLMVIVDSKMLRSSLIRLSSWRNLVLDFGFYWHIRKTNISF